MSDAKRVLVVTGLRREGRIAAGPGVSVVLSGGDRAALEGRLAVLVPAEFSAIVSFGLAGALEPSLAVGTTVIGTAVADGSRLHPADREIVAAWAQCFTEVGEAYREAVLAGVNEPILTPAAKAALGASTGADAIDMESHVAAEWADRHRLPLGILRVVSDPAGRALPPIAGAVMRSDGSIDVPALLGGLARDPRQIPALIQTARDAGSAFRTLRRVRGLLGPGLGFDL